jgi:hypothetical protein
MKSRYDSSKNIVHQFESLHSLVSYVKSLPLKSAFEGHNGSLDKTAEITLRGDETLVSKAEKLMSELEAKIETNSTSLEADVFGPVLSIPDYLANTPTPFRRLKTVISDVSPVRIFVGIACSGGLSPEEMERRGVAIMALAMALQAIRPVDVILYSEHGDDARVSDLLYTVTLESRPMSLAHSINAIANVNVARHLTMGIASNEGWSGHWPKGYSGRKPTPEYKVWRTDVLGITNQDIVLESPFYADEVINNPIAWINKHLGNYSEEN